MTLESHETALSYESPAPAKGKTHTRRVRKDYSSRAPMPFTVVRDSHVWATLVAAEAGALVYLVDSWWQSGGQPLPSDEARLMSLARCHLKRWQAIRERVLWALSELMPDLQRVYRIESAKHVTRKLTSMRMLAAQRALQASRGAERNVSAPVGGSTDTRQASKLLPAKNKILCSTPENGAPKRVIRGANAPLIDKR